MRSACIYCACLENLNDWFKLTQPVHDRTETSFQLADSWSSALFTTLRSDSGLYQTEQRKCSWARTRVNTPPSPWPWQLAKTGMRPNFVGPAAWWPWWKQSSDTEQREPEKNVLSYEEQSPGWLILPILVLIYRWTWVTPPWLSATLQESLSGCLSPSYTSFPRYFFRGPKCPEASWAHFAGCLRRT